MSLLKKMRDQIIKLAGGPKFVPEGLVELHKYFRLYKSIDFQHETREGHIISRSTNFQFGTIMTMGSSQAEVRNNEIDAILTAFSVPSSYKAWAQLRLVGEEQKAYALA